MEKVEISEDLLRVKDLIGKPKRYFNEKVEIKNQLEELGYKIEEIEKKIEDRGNFDLRKIKEIIFLLDDKELNSTEVGKILKISRNRANEYLIKMEKDGILTSRFVGKKKFYMVKHD
jgi:Fic family protein